MSNIQAATSGTINTFFTRWYASANPNNIKFALAGTSSVVFAATAGLAIAGWLMPLQPQAVAPEVAQSGNAQARLSKPLATGRVKVASLDGQIALPGPVRRKSPEKIAQSSQTIVPRQPDAELNPYTFQKQGPLSVPAKSGVSESQAPLPAPPAVAAPLQGDAELRVLTDNVVSRLQRLKRQETENTDGNLTPATTDLRQAIEVLVLQATSKGKSSAYIQALINDALTGRNAVPAALANSDGKLDTRSLLAAVIPKKQVGKVGDHDSDYLAALEKESRSITATGQPRAKKARLPRKRFVIVRKGDNLSKIATRVYGDPLGFDKIYRANRKTLTNANILTIGQRLFIPR